MQRLRYYILSLITVMLLGSCADDADMTEREVHFCVRAEWREGRGVSQTRAVSDDYKKNLLSSGQADIVIPVTDYPESIEVREGDSETPFTITKQGTTCTDHSEYIVYTTSTKFDNISQKTFMATATLDGEPLSGTASVANDGHVRFDLKHTRALLRFAFKVNGNYDKIRQVVVTNITLNSETCTIAKKVLNKDAQTIIAYAYIDSSVVTTSKENTLRCTYNIYDKDANFTPDANGVITDESLSNNASHLTRGAVIAQNTFTLNKIVFSSSEDDKKKILPGHYYDLNITINPDYLYVLSDHDNKHMTIN